MSTAHRQGEPSWALRFISGKYQGGEFPLPANRDVVIGRSGDIDMVLIEDMVSRQHAKISVQGDEILVEDLGSTNGTFVNGEKVKRARLQEGDRVLVGTSIMKLVALESGPSAVPARAGRGDGDRATSRPAERPMSGELEAIPLPDLLQMLSSSRKTGTLTLTGDGGRGTLHFRNGKLAFVVLDGVDTSRPQKALFRLLAWTSGHFDLGPVTDPPEQPELTESTDALLLEGLHQLDDYRRIAPRLPATGAHLAVPTPLAGRLRDLSPEDLDLFQLVLDHGTLAIVLDGFAGTDLDAAKRLLTLIDSNLVVVA